MNSWTWTAVPAFAFALSLSPPAVASTRLAVLIVADEAALSDNLTEVAIARLAEKPGYELLGVRELEARLNELSTVKTEGLRACLAQPACLSQVTELAGVERAVVGDVRREAARYRVELSLVQGKTGTADARLSRESPLDVEHLIATVQAGVFELVPDAQNEVEQAAPVARVESSPPPREIPPAPEETSGHSRSSDGPSVSVYVAYSTGALAVVALSAAIVTGTIGAAPPVGNSRAEVQNDLERREKYASLSNGLFVAGGVLAGASVVSFVVSWD